MKRIFYIVCLLLLMALFASCQEASTTTLPGISGAPDETTRPIDPNCQHVLEQTVVPPSCTQGYTLHYCTKCAYSYTDSFTEAIGHDFKDTVTPPTCGKKGYTTHVCKTCGHTVKDSETAALSHEYGKFVVTSEATLTKNGTRTASCLHCQDKKTESFLHEWNLTASEGLVFEDVYGKTGEARLRSLGTCRDKVVKIPALTPDGKIVTEIFSLVNHISDTTVVTELILPDTVTVIDAEAFAHSVSLEKVNIPKAVSEIGSYLFKNSPNVTSIQFDAERCLTAKSKPYDNGALHGSSVTTLTVGEGVKVIPSYLCQGAEQLETVDILGSLEEIRYKAFFGTKSLKTAVIPDSVTTIADYAFASSGHFAADLPSSLETIGEYAFYNTPAVFETLTIGNAVSLPLYVFGGNETAVTIGHLRVTNDVKSTEALSSPTEYQHFFGKATIKKLTVADSVESLPNAFFAHAVLPREVILPKGMTALPIAFMNGAQGVETVTLGANTIQVSDRAFQNCSALKTVNGINKVTVLGNAAFGGCSALTTLNLSFVMEFGAYIFENSGIRSLTLSNRLTTLPASLFYGCKALTSYTVPAGITAIGDNAFSGSGLVSITLPETVTTLSARAFMNCVSLESVVILGAVETLPSEIFSGCEKLKSVTLPQTLETVGFRAFLYCKALNRINIPDSLTSIGDSAFTGALSLTHIVFPDGLETLGKSAFADCQALLSVSLPKTLKSISESAFSGTGLVSLSLPDSVTTIGDSAFCGCLALADVTFGKGLRSIGRQAFMGTALTEVILPDGMLTIMMSAFNGCSKLETVYLGHSLTELGSYAFSGCVLLKTIFLPESLAAMTPGKNDVSPFAKISPTVYTAMQGLSEEALKYFTYPNYVSSYEEYLTKV